MAMRWIFIILLCCFCNLSWGADVSAGGTTRRNRIQEFKHRKCQFKFISVSNIGIQFNLGKR